MGLQNLHFASGITLTRDEAALLFAETAAARISRYDLATGDVTVLVDNLPGYPDNLSRPRDGRFWPALTNPREPALEKLATARPRLRELRSWVTVRAITASGASSAMWWPPFTASPVTSSAQVREISVGSP